MKKAKYRENLSNYYNSNENAKMREKCTIIRCHRVDVSQSAENSLNRS